MEATNFDEDLYQIAVELYEKCKVSEKIRLLGITASNLTIHEQPILFAKNNKKKELYHAVDGIRTRFGNHMITKAKLLKNRD